MRGPKWFLGYVMFRWRNRYYVFEDLGRREFIKLVCDAAGNSNGVAHIAKAVLEMCLPGSISEKLPGDEESLLKQILRYSPEIGLPKSKSTVILVDSATVPKGPAEAIAESFRTVIELECRTDGFHDILDAIIISGHPVHSTRRWNRRKWKTALRSESPEGWGGEAPRLNHEFVSARYLVKHRNWVGRLLHLDPIQRDCIIVTPPCGDELKNLDGALEIRMAVLRWEFLQPIIVRFHARRFLSLRLVYQVWRRLQINGALPCSTRVIRGCCDTVHEIIVALLQSKYWYPGQEKAIQTLEMLKFCNSNPEYKGFLNREVLFDVLAGVAGASIDDRSPAVQPEIIEQLAIFLGADRDIILVALEEFYAGFGQLHFYHCEISKLARCVAGIMRCKELASGVVDHHPPGS